MPTNVTVPPMGESVSEATVLRWIKQDGEYVKQDEPVVEMETDKANADIPAPVAGVFKSTVAIGTKVKIGDVIGTIDPAGKPTASPKAEEKAPAMAKVPDKTPPAATEQTAAPGDALSPAVRRMVTEHKLDAAQIPGTGRGGRVTKEDVVNFMGQETAPTTGPLATPIPAPGGIRRETMSKIRKKIAENLVRANQTAAILTTFNEVDMSAIMDLRAKYKEKFEKQHQIGLGFMSFFAKACCQALKEFEKVNASIEGDDIVYHDYVHLGIAVSTERGLAVPVLRNADQMSFAKVESEIKRVAIATREGKLGLNELSGGTFTITNGGIFGSMLSTPILNPPQSAILGMHNIVKRAVVVNDQIVVRPMMYLALSYDHRLIDGRESVTFLVRVKELLEDPTRLMLEI